MTSDGDYELPSMSRREAMSAGSAAAVAVGSGLLAQSLIGAAAAQTQEPRISLGPDWVIDDDPDGSGHFVIEHTPNGNEYVFRDDGRLVLSEADIGQLAAALDANGQDITGVGSLATEERTITNLGARGESDGTQSITNGTSTDIEIDSAAFEETDIATVDEANNNIVINKAGRYDIKCGLRFQDSLSDGTRFIVGPSVNGVSESRFDVVLGGSVAPSATVSTTKELSANDEVTWFGFQDDSDGNNKSLRDDGSFLAVTQEG